MGFIERSLDDRDREYLRVVANHEDFLGRYNGHRGVADDLLRLMRRSP